MLVLLLLWNWSFKATALEVCSSNTSDWSSCGGVTEDYMPWEHRKDLLCDGFVNKIYIPMGQESVNYPGPPPHNVASYQKDLEDRVHDIVDGLPVWLDRNCFMSMKKYICTSIMLSPVRDPTHNVVVPSYPNYSICLDYKNSCRDFLLGAPRNRLNSIDSLAKPDCDAEINGVRQFPVEDQIVLQLQNLSALIDVISPPNGVADLDSDPEYDPVCPYGFVIPDDPDSEDNWWIKGSACAVACQSPLYTEEEWERLDLATTIIVCTALPLIAGLFTYTLTTEKTGTSSILLTFSFISLMGTIYGVWLTAVPFEKRYCRNNANGYKIEDGTTYCTVQSGMKVYVGMALCLTWTVQAYALFQKVVMNAKLTQKYMKFLFSMIFILPVFSVVYILESGAAGYSPGYTNCVFTQEAILAGHDMACFYGPIMVLVLINVTCMGLVLRKMGNLVMKSVAHKNAAVAPVVQPEDADDPREPASNNDLWQVFRILQTPIIFTIFFTLMFMTVLYYRINVEEVFKRSDDEFLHWSHCVFNGAYNGDANGSYDQCGTHPEYRISFRAQVFVTLCIAGMGIFITLANINYGYFFADCCICAPAKLTSSAPPSTLRHPQPDLVAPVSGPNIGTGGGEGGGISGGSNSKSKGDGEELDVVGDGKPSFSSLLKSSFKRSAVSFRSSQSSFPFVAVSHFSNPEKSFVYDDDSSLISPTKSGKEHSLPTPLPAVADVEACAAEENVEAKHSEDSERYIVPVSNLNEVLKY